MLTHFFFENNMASKKKFRANLHYYLSVRFLNLDIFWVGYLNLDNSLR